MKSKISLYTPPFRGITSYCEMVDIAHKYGLNLETINLFELAEPDLEFAKKLRRYADGRGVRFTCVSVGINLVGEDAAQAVERAKGYADVAAILGSEYIHHTVALQTDAPDSVLARCGLYIERGIGAVCEIFDYAKMRGVAAVHEPQGFVFNGADGVRMIAEKSRRPCGVVADFGNVLFVDERIEDFVPKLAGRIVNVHVKDYKTYPAGTYDENAYEFMSVSHTALADCPLGEGVVDFDRGFAELDKIGYRGSVALECLPAGADDTAEFEHNLGFLKRYVE